MSTASSPLAPGSGAAPASDDTDVAAPGRRQAYGVLVRAKSKGGVYDLVVYQDALLISHGSATDAVLPGALIGAVVASVLGALVGAMIGEHIARAGARKRLHDLFYAAPEYVFGADRRNRLVRGTDVKFARLIEYGARQRVLELRLRDGTKPRLRFDSRFQSNSFATETLRFAIGGRMRVERHRVRLASIAGAVAATAFVSLLSAFIIAVTVGAIS